MFARIFLCVSLFLAAHQVRCNFTLIPSYSIGSTPAPSKSSIVPSTSSNFTITPTLIPSKTHSIMPTPTPTSTPPPPKPPVPFCYTLNVTNSTNPCVKLRVGRYINITSNLTLFKGVPILFPGPSNVNISGQCPVIISGGLASSKISLKWPKTSKIWHQLTFSFLLNQSPNSGRYGALDTWYMDSVSYLYHNGANYSYTAHLNETETISAQNRQAYTCSKNLTLELTQEPNINGTGTNITGTETNITLSSYTVQPFALNLTGYNFEYFDDCVPSGIPIIVPIIVACVLAGFVAILLVLYVIGRFRAKKKGQYERLT